MSRIPILASRHPHEDEYAARASSSPPPWRGEAAEPRQRRFLDRLLAYVRRASRREPEVAVIYRPSAKPRMSSHEASIDGRVRSRRRQHAVREARHDRVDRLLAFLGGCFGLRKRRGRRQAEAAVRRHYGLAR